MRSCRRLAAIAAVAIIAAATLTGCATLKPGTGDISFRLRWEGSADLDLHVVDPIGRHIGLAHVLRSEESEEAQLRQERSEKAQADHPDAAPGILDIDCNADSEKICAKPIENIFWPTSTALRGSYEVWVHYFQDISGEKDVPYVLEIRRGERVVERQNGKLGASQRRSPSFRVEY
jgi:hypothetical protein